MTSEQTTLIRNALDWLAEHPTQWTTGSYVSFERGRVCYCVLGAAALVGMNESYGCGAVEAVAAEWFGSTDTGWEDDVIQEIVRQNDSAGDVWDAIRRIRAILDGEAS